MNWHFWKSESWSRDVQCSYCGLTLAEYDRCKRECPGEEGCTHSEIDVAPEGGIEVDA